MFGALCFCCCWGPVPSLVWELGSPPVVRQNQRKKEREEERKKREQKKKITNTCKRWISMFIISHSLGEGTIEGLSMIFKKYHWIWIWYIEGFVYSNLWSYLGNSILNDLQILDFLKLLNSNKSSYNIHILWLIRRTFILIERTISSPVKIFHVTDQKQMAHSLTS